MAAVYRRLAPRCLPPGHLLTIIRKWRGMSRTCLCPCTDIITFGLWWQDVLCLGGGLGRGIEDHGFWLYSKLTSNPQSEAMNPNKRSSVAALGAQLSLLSSEMDACLLQESRIQPSLTIGAIFSDKKVFNWQYLRKTHILNYLFTLGWLLGLQFHNFSCLFSILFFAVMPLRQSRALCAKDIHGKTSRGCWDQPLLSNNSN